MKSIAKFPLVQHYVYKNIILKNSEAWKHERNTYIFVKNKNIYVRRILFIYRAKNKYYMNFLFHVSHSIFNSVNIKERALMKYFLFHYSGKATHNFLHYMNYHLRHKYHRACVDIKIYACCSNCLYIFLHRLNAKWVSTRNNQYIGLWR